jgi:DNA-binding response OmpR family regulator
MSYVIAVDDEIDVLNTLGRAIESDAIRVKLINNSTEAEAIITSEKPDLVILDIVMPVVDGITICQNLRDNPNLMDLPILFLTAKGRTDDVVAGLDAGADDYIVKPFHLAELRARVNALLRRGTYDARDQSVIEVGELVLNSRKHTVQFEENVTQLTATEHRLLRYLMVNVNAPQSPTHLLTAVWDYPPQTGDPDLVRAHVRNIRTKLKRLTGNRIIETVHGVGYIVSDSADT